MSKEQHQETKIERISDERFLEIVMSMPKGDRRSYDEWISDQHKPDHHHSAVINLYMLQHFWDKYPELECISAREVVAISERLKRKSE